MRSLSKALVLIVVLASASPSFAVDKPSGGAAAPITGKKMAPTNLSSSDCRLGSGTIVSVSDDRCGATYQYCKQHDGSARCIDKVD